MKKITITIPTYNRLDFLLQLIKTIPNKIKIHISDNGNFIKNKINQDNITINSTQSVISSIKNWNLCIKESEETDYIAICSDDDTYVKDGFNIILETINNYDADMFIFGNNFIDENNSITGTYCPKEFEILESPNGFDKFKYGVEARTLSIFFKKSFLDKIGHLDDEKFEITAADSELIQRGLLLGKVIFVPKIVSNYRVWSNNETSKWITTKNWLDEIDIWTNKIIKLANSTLTEKQNNFDWDKYKDEIYARNLLGGLANLYRLKNYTEVFNHYSNARYPKYSFLKTKLRIWKILLFSKLKTLNAN